MLKKCTIIISFILIFSLNYEILTRKIEPNINVESLNTIIIEYFKFKGIKNVVIVQCNNKSNSGLFKDTYFTSIKNIYNNDDKKNNSYNINSNLKSIKNFINAGFYLNIFQLNKRSPEDFKLNRAYKTGIILDSVDDCTIEESQEIFKIADKRNFFTSNNFWLVTVSNVNDFNSIDLIFNDVFITPDSDVKILIPNIIPTVLSLPLSVTEEVNMKYNIFSYNSNRLIVNSNRFDQMQKIKSIQLNKQKNGDIDNHLNVDGNNDDVTTKNNYVNKNNLRNKAKFFEVMLLDVYRIAPFKPLKFQILSMNITNFDDFTESLKNFGVFTAKRKNLENIKILCGVVIEFPDAFTTFEDVNSRHINTIAKVNYPLMVNLKSDLNFSFDLMQMDNYGWNHSNGHFDGMMGHFQRGTIDFGVNPVFMRLDRLTLCDFAAETFNIRACIIFRQPPLSAVENIFTLPFSLDVWISCLVFVVITTILLIIHLIIHPITTKMDFNEPLIFVWGAVCQQGFHVDFYSASGRYIVVTTFISTLFLFTSFSANIVALLQSPSEAIKTVNDLTHSPLDAAAQDVKYNKIYFEEVTDAETQALYKKKIAPKGENAFIRPNEGMEKVRNGLFAYQVESQAAYQIVSDTYNEHEKCGLKELELFQLPVMSIPIKKNFPYKELFRQRLRWQRENGLMNREFRKWLPAKPRCENRVAGFVSIGLTESRYPLLYFASGFVLAILSFIIELLWYYTKKQLNKFYKRKQNRKK